MKYAYGIALVALCGVFAATVRAQEARTMPPRESTEWCSITSHDASSADLPRAVVIGDSIASRYAGAVRNGLKGKAYLSVLATSKAVGDPALLDEVKTILGQYTFAVVHFNIGLHGGGGSEAYRKGFPELIATIRTHAAGAKLIWATTTPCKGEGGMTQRAREFNKIAAEFVEKEEDIAVDDLYALVMSNADNPEVLWDGSGVHFTTEGAALQGKHVAESILAAMPAQPEAE